MFRIGLLAAWAVLVSQAALLAGGWERLDRCEFFEGSSSDGDSIEVHRGNRHYIFRLYFVDCVEKNPLSRARRSEQGRYFGLKSSEGTPLRAAYLAKNFTREKLREPFTIFTRWQRVDPGGDNPAFRAFVETADGEDLATLLVTEGLAIIRHGDSAVSDHPEGQSSEQISSELRRAEAEAKIRKRGAWGLAGVVESDRTEDVLMATDHQALVSRAGSRVKVRGRVSRVGALPDGRMTFVNFNGDGKEGFVAIVRANALPRFSKQFPKGLKSALVDRDVLLEGVITLYRGAPQIELESPAQIHIERHDKKPASTIPSANLRREFSNPGFFSPSREIRVAWRSIEQSTPTCSWRRPGPLAPCVRGQRLRDHALGAGFSRIGLGSLDHGASELGGTPAVGIARQGEPAGGILEGNG
jgi:endonuclease YncB( thermonuclease family)